MTEFWHLSLKNISDYLSVLYVILSHEINNNKEAHFHFGIEHLGVVMVWQTEAAAAGQSQPGCAGIIEGCVNSRGAGRMGSLIWGGNHHNISLSICSLLAMKTALTLISHLHSSCLTGGDPECLMRKPHTPKTNRAERWRGQYSEVVQQQIKQTHCMHAYYTNPPWPACSCISND